MKLTLSNIIDTLEKACRLVKGVEDADLLICIGNTGSGKSTLLASLIYGPEKMVVETIEKKVKSNPNSTKEKTMKKTVI